MGETITINKNSLWKYSTFILLAVVIVGAFVMFRGDNSSPTGNVVNNGANNLPAPTRPAQVSATADDDAILGNANAKVTVIEFSDYQCPFCSRFWSGALPTIKSEYVDTGKVKFVYRDFPLTSIHPLAQISAEAVECVREKGGDAAYYKMHDKIFGNQAALSEANLKVWANELGYNIDACLSSRKFQAEVEKDTQDATGAAGCRGTPCTIIGSQQISGACPGTTFSAAIDAELEGNKDWYVANCQFYEG